MKMTMHFTAEVWKMIFGEEHKDCLSGFGVQHNLNGGKCGICGDPWNSWPR